jgi:fatty acid desaturase
VPPGRADRPDDAGRAIATSQRSAGPPPTSPISARPSPAAGGSSDRDPGIELLLVFVVAALVMVVAVAIVAVVGRWWVLVPVMLVDFVATFAVIAGIMHLLGDGGDARV